MRLDKYLKISRIIKRRSVANEACNTGRVIVNGKVAKASLEVKPNDLIEISFGNSTTKFQVISVKDIIKKEEASSLYKIIE